jgi:hypothetical protein
METVRRSWPIAELAFIQGDEIVSFVSTKVATRNGAVLEML